jgi:uncharacterized protein (DUF2267 family)
MPNELRPPKDLEAKLHRRDARAEQTYREFLKRLCKRGSMSEEFAERSAVAVVSALESRLTEREAKQLEAQLPVRLIKLLCNSSFSLSDSPSKADREMFLDGIGTELGLGQGDVEPVVRNVFSEVRALISEGEAEDVAAQLPSDLAALWAEAA